MKQPLTFRHADSRDWQPLAFVAVGLLLLGIAATRNRPLAQTRRPPTLQGPSHPSTLAATVVLGGFRGIAADLLWLYATRLQDEGRYFELVQLADWITTLEPRLTDVWAFHAWNMAYNISIMMPDHDDRWRWVQNGIRLLRDRGLRENPSDPDLYGELALLFYHKIGGNTDDAADYYKRRWAMSMMRAVGPDGRAHYDTLRGTPRRLSRLQEYGLVPNHMKAVESRYGPLDWRVPETHALYWATLGSDASGSQTPTPFCDRLIYQSLTALFEHGQLTYDAQSDIFVTAPDFDMLPGAIAAFETAIANAANDIPEKAFAAFLASATRTLAFYQHNTEAKKLFKTLHDRFPSPATEKGFEAFIHRGRRARLPEILYPPQQEQKP